MTQAVRDPLYRRHRFPTEVIAQAVWLCLRFPLSLRMVEDLLAASGIIVSHQTVRLWVKKFGRHFANEIRVQSAGKLGANGISMKSSSPSTAKSTGCGEPLIRLALFSMCWCRAAVVPRQPNALCESFSKDRVKHPV